ncbi:MAG TPA: Rrf2 family transcriptional regulator [Bacteroidota bacterium]|nr:Rrf2 family transcriptional regulator [Bacteroidota bacterium]
MQLTMTGEYAIRAILSLAADPDGKAQQISDIARNWEIPENLLRKIIPQLSRAGLIHTRRGTNGGIRLAIPADVLTLLDVIEAVEGKLSLNRCLIHSDFCHRERSCPVHGVWCEAQSALKQILRQKTFAELARQNAAQSSEQLVTVS